MKNIIKNKKLGTILFYLLWPLVWLYSPLNKRVRVIIRNQNEVLVVKNWFGPNVWQLPGGGIKRGESIIDCAVREIREEVNINIDIQNAKTLNQEVLEFKQFGLKFLYYYVLIDVEPAPSVSISSEISSYRWTDVDELNIPSIIAESL